MSSLISVIVCTYNRADLLADVLGTLCNQSLDRNEYELIVVDNNSSDHTADVAAMFCKRYSNVRYCIERNQGLSHARNRGWQEAKGEYVAYTDDDCKVPENWLSSAKDLIELISPGVFGGPYFCFFNTPRPRWFKDSYESRGYGDEGRALGFGEDLIGNNLFFRRSLLQALGGFDARLGMNGKKVAYGEETALQWRVRSEMPDEVIYYDPDLYLYHLVRPEQVTLGWLTRAFFAKGRYVYMVSRGDQAEPISRVVFIKESVRRLCGLALDLTFGLIRRDRKNYPYAQNYLYERSSRYLHGLGRLYAQYRHINEKVGQIHATAGTSGFHTLEGKVSENER